MEPLQMLELYQQFKRQHKEIIAEALKAEYNRVFEDTYKHVIHCTDFGFMVGVPLLAVAIAWMCTDRTLSDWLIAGIMIAVGCVIRYHQKLVIECTCEYAFRERRYDIIADYVDNQMHEVMRNQPEPMHDETHALYRYFYSQLICEKFDMRNKKNEKQKLTK